MEIKLNYDFELPESTRGRYSSHYVKAVDSFLDSGKDIAEIEHEQTSVVKVRSMRQMFYAVVKRNKLNVKVIQRGTRLFLATEAAHDS